MFESPVPLLRLGLLALFSVLLLGCGTLDNASGRLVNAVSPYKIDIVQGNFVSREQAAVLKPGMVRQQVRDILGTPLLVSVFHADRWDYVFTFKRQGQEPQARRVTVLFDGETLKSVQADDLPSEAEFVASLDSGRSKGVVPPLELTPEALQALQKPAKPTAAMPVAQPGVVYPPLEAKP